MSQLDIKIGPKIKAFRRQLGLQANKLSEDLGISPSYLNLIESGKRKIDGDLLLKVCDKLKIQLSDLTSKSDINLENTISEIEVYDLSGKLVWTKKGFEVSNTEIQLNLSAVSNGVYFVKITADTQSIVKRIIKE